MTQIDKRTVARWGTGFALTVSVAIGTAALAQTPDRTAQASRRAHLLRQSRRRLPLQSYRPIGQPHLACRLWKFCLHPTPSI